MGSHADASHHYEFRAMGSTITILSNRTTGLSYWERPIHTLFEQVEHTASRFLPHSELSRLNDTPPMQWIEVTPTFHQLLARTAHYATYTDYLFQPFIGSALQDWGYRKSFELLDSDFTMDSHQARLRYDVPPRILFHEHERSIQRTTPHQLDLGGIGKGWTAQWASRVMRDVFNVHSGCIDAGGDMVVWSNNDPWLIGVQNPYDSEKEIAQLEIRQAAIATSNTIYRHWNVDGQPIHHIFHGQTGMPVHSDIVQATVCGPSADEAEVAAKIMCMLGTGQAVDWMNNYFPELGFLYVHESGDIQMNRKLFDYVERLL